jgi:ribosomal protein S16
MGAFTGVSSQPGMKTDGNDEKGAALSDKCSRAGRVIAPWIRRFNPKSEPGRSQHRLSSVRIRPVIGEGARPGGRVGKRV